MEVHRVKSWPDLFEATKTGEKKHDLRRLSDRNYQINDILILQEYDPIKSSYTGRELITQITYITSKSNMCALSNFGLNEEYCILSLRLYNSKDEEYK